MKLYSPGYYKRFKCIGGACPDNCCIGWQIDVDEDTLFYYDEIEGEVGEMIRASIERSGDVSHFRLTNGERCQNLDENNLCKIICALGEEGLCEICHEHPRYYLSPGTSREVGVGIACPAAAELILSMTKEDMELVELGECFIDPDPVHEASLTAILFLRKLLFEILGEFDARGAVKFIETHQRFTMDFIAMALDEGTVSKRGLTKRYLRALVKSSVSESAEDTLPQIRKLYLSLEYLDPDFKGAVCDAFSLIEESPDKVGRYLNGEGKDNLCRLLYYFAHRYLIDGATDGQFDVRLRHAFISSVIISVVALLRGGNDKTASAAIDYSKNIEYSDINLDNIFCGIDKDGFTYVDSLTQLILSVESDS